MTFHHSNIGHKYLVFRFPLLFKENSQLHNTYCMFLTYLFCGSFLGAKRLEAGCTEGIRNTDVDLNWSKTGRLWNGLDFVCFDNLKIPVFNDQTIAMVLNFQKLDYSNTDLQIVRILSDSDFKWSNDPRFGRFGF